MNSLSEVYPRLSTPDVLTAVRWDPILARAELVKGKSIADPESTFSRFKEYISGKRLRLVKNLGALRGGRMLAPQKQIIDDNTRKHLAVERTIAVIPAIAEDGQQLNRIIHYPTEAKDIHFSANLAGYRELVAACAAGGWNEKDLGTFPIPLASSTDPNEFFTQHIDEGYVTVTEYRTGISSLGLDGPKKGIHQMNTKKISLEETRRLVRVLDVVHMESEGFLGWLDANEKKKVPPVESWLNENNARCALRGQEWWINESASDDRLRELKRLARGDVKEYQDVASQIVDLYNETFEQDRFPALLESMIRNNLSLYRHQNGEIDDLNLVADTVVVHGTLNPDQIHIRQDSTGKINYTITGGDRAQLYGLRGQMIDWLVSGCAASPEHQNALIDEFMKIQKEQGRDEMKELRGLAMHVMYRCISETPWFVKEGKITEARNLVKMTQDILQGNGIWEGVNRPLQK